MKKQIQVKQLPTQIQNALTCEGFGKNARIYVERVAIDDTYNRECYASKGSRGICLEIEGGHIDRHVGSWGGPNMFTSPTADRDPSVLREDGKRQNTLKHREGLSVFKGTIGYVKYGTLYLCEDDYDTLIPDAPRVFLSEKGWEALSLFRGYKSSYRREQFPRRGLGMYGCDNPYIKELESVRFVKVARNGAVSVTMEGRNAERPDPEMLKAQLEAEAARLEEALFEEGVMS